MLLNDVKKGDVLMVRRGPRGDCHLVLVLNVISWSHVVVLEDGAVERVPVSWLSPANYMPKARRC